MLQATASKSDNGRVLAAIAAEIRTSEIGFPTTAQMALRIREALNDPDCPASKTTRLIAAEPLLAARIVGIANSVLFARSGGVVTDLPAAVARVGFSMVRSVATAVILRQMANAPAVPAHRALAAQLWDHTTRMAALAGVLASRVTGQNPETALFAGLVHEVGGFYLISRAADHPEVLHGELAHQWFHGEGEEGAHPGDGQSGFESSIGRAVLEALAVPAPVVEAVETLWNGYLTLPPSTLGDTLLLADQLVPVRSPFELQQDVDTPHARAIMDLAFNDALLSDILKEATTDIEALAAILKG